MSIAVAIFVNTDMRRTWTLHTSIHTSNSFKAFVKQLTLALFHTGAIVLYRSHRIRLEINKHTGFIYLV